MSRTTGSGDALFDTLRSSSLFSGATDEGLRALAKASNVVQLQKGERFVEEGAIPRCLGVVMSGRARAVHYNPDGRPITMFVTWPGDPFAVMATLSEHVVEADIEAAELTTVACVPRSAIESLIEREPHVALSILKSITEQVFMIMNMAKSLGSDVNTRVAYYIHTRAPIEEAASGEPPSVDLGVTRAELAAQLGTVPETLSRVFSSLEDSGLIEAHGRTVKILDRARLAAIASGISAHPHQ